MNTVWVLVYEHKHGHDVSVYASEELATNAVWGIMAEYEDDLKDHIKPASYRAFVRNVEAKNYGAATQTWAEEMEEYFDVGEYRIFSPVASEAAEFVDHEQAEGT